MRKHRSSLCLIIISTLIIVLYSPFFAFAETIILKSGKTIEGKIIEKTGEYIKIDFYGVALTYWFDEIESIDGVKPVSPATERNNLPRENNPPISSESAKEAIDKGIEYGKQGNYDEAISEFTKAIELNPNYAETYNNRAIAYFQKQDYDKSWNDVHKLEELGGWLDPRFLEALKKASGRER